MRKLRFAGAACALWALGFAAAGCGGDNGGNPTGYFPEGQAGQNAYLFTIPLPAGTDSSQVFLFANILAPPPTDGFRVYINPGGPGGEGFRPATDVAVPPVGSTGAGYNTYFTLVEGYDPEEGAEVVARGARGGFETSYAPVTNVSTVSAGLPIELLRREPVPLLTPLDSTQVFTLHPTLTWQALPSASYLLTVSLSTGQPIYVVYTTEASHTIGLSPGVVFENQPIRDGGFYVWSVQALDGGNRVFGLSPAPNAFFVNLPDLP